MQYKCKTVSVSQLIATYSGFVKSLCDRCKSYDCSNPIEKRRISIVGITKEIRVYSSGDNASFVVDCQGYIE